MRHYEVMIILDPTVDERTVPKSLENFLKVIRSGGGSVERVDVWGRRRLAYEINKQHEGIYAVLDVNSEPDVVAELDRQLTLNESVLRTKVLRRETTRATKAAAKSTAPATAKAPAKPAAKPASAKPAAKSTVKA
ncbi:MAG: 30S ribosomal protein S6 [Sciscionella sp.]|nr:30S ribosomal protein S6 [Sciscionella sp.]